LSDEDCVGWNVASGGRGFLSVCLFSHVLFTSVSKARANGWFIDR